jgi:hypothetical protein
VPSHLQFDRDVCARHCAKECESRFLIRGHIGQGA